MTKFEAFEQIFKRLTINEMISIYTFRFNNTSIYELNASNLNSIFSRFTPNELLNIFSKNINIEDDWIVIKYNFDSAYNIEHKSYKTKDLLKLFYSKLYDLYIDSDCWQYYITKGKIVKYMQDTATSIIKSFKIIEDDYYIEHYVRFEKRWVYEESDEYNFQKIIKYFEKYKKLIEAEKGKYTSDLCDDDGLFWHIQNEFMNNGYISINNI